LKWNVIGIEEFVQIEVDHKSEDGPVTILNKGKRKGALGKYYGMARYQVDL